MHNDAKMMYSSDNSELIYSIILALFIFSIGIYDIARFALYLFVQKKKQNVFLKKSWRREKRYIKVDFLKIYYRLFSLVTL